MLVPVKQHIPLRLDPAETITFQLESIAAVTPVYFPKVFFLNTATVSTVRVVVKQSFVVGPSTDPLVSANFTSILSDDTLDPSGDRVSVALETVAVDGTLDFHTIEVTNLGLVEEIVHVWFEGLYEESLSISPTFPTTIL